MIGGPRWLCSRVVGWSTVCDSASRGTCDEAELDKTGQRERVGRLATECNSHREQHTRRRSHCAYMHLQCRLHTAFTSHQVPPGPARPAPVMPQVRVTARHGSPLLACTRTQRSTCSCHAGRCPLCAAEAAGNISNRWSGEGHEWRREAADWPEQPPAVFVLSCHAREPETHHSHHRASPDSYASEAHARK
jgi:hypothetical protein